MRNFYKGLAAVGVGAALVSALPMLAFADTLAAPTNLSPSDGATLTSDQWTSAQWSAVTGTSTPITYQYESSTSSSTNADGSFTAPVFQSGTLSSTSISTTGTPPGMYWWHARAMDSTGTTSPWSAPSMVTITGTSTGTSTSATTTPLMAPTNTSPSNGATLTTSQLSTANWTSVTGSSTPITYQYESSNSSSTNADGSFASPIYQTSGLANPSVDITSTAPGTYWWHARAMDSMGSTSPWSTPFQLVVTSATSTGTTTSSVQDLINDLTNLQGQFPSFTSQIQGLINELNGTGTTTPPSNNTGGATLDNNGQTVGAGTSIDIGGRNFGHEETVKVWLNGILIATPHADGGGNFTTGSLPAPVNPGTYVYTAVGQTSGDTVTATVTVQ